MLSSAENGFYFFDDTDALSSLAFLTLPFRGQLAQYALCFGKITFRLRSVMRFAIRQYCGLVRGFILSHALGESIFPAHLFAYPCHSHSSAPGNVWRVTRPSVWPAASAKT